MNENVSEKKEIKKSEGCLFVCFYLSACFISFGFIFFKFSLGDTVRVRGGYGVPGVSIIRVHDMKFQKN